MSGTDWSRDEVEAIIDDYLAMLAAEPAGVRYNKAAHRRASAHSTPNALNTASTGSA